MKVGICTGGGDCPGLNAVIRAAVKYGIRQYNMELWGIKDSFNGLMDRPYSIRRLEIDHVTDLLFKGGTVLGTTNSGNPFSIKKSATTNGNTSGIDKSKLVLEAYKDLKLDCIIVIGGDGTQAIGHQLSTLGINVVGVPKTIDNDLASTDQTVGFDTAVNVATEAIERLQSTAESHERIMILEVMGRGAGHIALSSGIAGGAHVILVPEIPFTYDAIINKIHERRTLGRNYSVIVAAEGAFEKGQNQEFTKSASGMINLGGIGRTIGSELFKRCQVETRVTVLGHTQRGGTPSAVDRILGTAYGVQVIDMVARRDYGKIVSYHKGRFTQITYHDVAGKFRPIAADDANLHAAEGIGICLGR